MFTFRITAALMTFLSIALTGCETTTSAGAVGAERKQLMLVSSQQLNEMASQAYAQLLAEAAQKRVLNTDAAMTQRVRSIANRIIPHTGVFRQDAPGWKWEVNVINSAERGRRMADLSEEGRLEWKEEQAQPCARKEDTGRRAVALSVSPRRTPR